MSTVCTVVWLSPHFPLQVCSNLSGGLMEVPVWERVTMRLCGVPVSKSLSDVGFGIIFKWLLFLRTAPDGVSRSWRFCGLNNPTISGFFTCHDYDFWSIRYLRLFLSTVSSLQIFLLFLFKLSIGSFELRKIRPILGQHLLGLGHRRSDPSTHQSSAGLHPHHGIGVAR